jgi:hypothetical protein
VSVLHCYYSQNGSAVLDRSKHETLLLLLYDGVVSEQVRGQDLKDAKKKILTNKTPFYSTARPTCRRDFVSQVIMNIFA